MDPHRSRRKHVLRPKGATFETIDEDFLVSDNIDFHPTDVFEDADGSLIVVDTGGWYKLCCPTSQLWKPDLAAPTDGLPTYAQALHTQANSGLSFEQIDARLRHNDKNRLYDE